MIIYKSPITSISWEELELLSLKVAELESMLSWLTQYGEHVNETGCIISAVERIANWLQADVLALITAYRTQHPTTTRTAEPDTRSDIQTLRGLLVDIQTRYHDHQAVDDLLADAVDLANGLRDQTAGGEA